MTLESQHYLDEFVDHLFWFIRSLEEVHSNWIQKAKNKCDIHAIPEQRSQKDCNTQKANDTQNANQDLAEVISLLVPVPDEFKWVLEKERDCGRKLIVSRDRAFEFRNAINGLAPKIVSLVIPPPNQTRIQFVVSIKDDVEDAWNLCRFVHCLSPDEIPDDPDFARIVDELHTRLPALRNQLAESVCHIRHTMELTPNNGGSSELPKKTRKGQRTRSPKIVLREKRIAVMIADGKSHDDISDRFSKDGVSGKYSRQIKTRLKQRIKAFLQSHPTDEDLRTEFGFRKDQTRKNILLRFGVDLENVTKRDT